MLAGAVPIWNLVDGCQTLLRRWRSIHWEDSAALERASVIRAVRTESGIDRFDLLETIREFGLEQLDRIGERAAAEHARAVLLTGIAEMTSQAMWSGAWRPAVAWD